MMHGGENARQIDIPDPKWNRYRSNSLNYHVKVFDEEGSVIAQSRWKIELIDSLLYNRIEEWWLTASASA